MKQSSRAEIPVPGRTECYSVVRCSLRRTRAQGKVVEPPQNGARRRSLRPQPRPGVPAMPSLDFTLFSPRLFGATCAERRGDTPSSPELKLRLPRLTHFVRQSATGTERGLPVFPKVPGTLSSASLTYITCHHLMAITEYPTYQRTKQTRLGGPSSQSAYYLIAPPRGRRLQERRFHLHFHRNLHLHSSPTGSSRGRASAS